MSAADRALAEKAKASGTSFQNRDEAVGQFRQKYATQYTTRYDSEPVSRPSYVPRSTYVDNRSYNIYYDRTYRGYGYMDYYGHWRYYDPFLDAVILSSIMSDHSYYYPPPQTVVVQQQPTVVVNSDGSVQQVQQPPVIVQQPSQPVIVSNSGGGWGMGLFFGIIAGVIVLAIIGYLVSRD